LPSSRRRKPAWGAARPRRARPDRWWPGRGIARCRRRRAICIWPASSSAMRRTRSSSGYSERRSRR